MPGAKPKPAKLHLLHGTDRKDRARADDVQPEKLTEVPEKPSWLGGNARKVWDEYAPKLVKLGLLTEIDIASFAMLCQQYGNYLGDQKQMKKTVASDLAQIRALLSEFGMSPSSRRGLALKQPKKKAADPWDDL